MFQLFFQHFLAVENLSTLANPQSRLNCKKNYILILNVHKTLYNTLIYFTRGSPLLFATVAIIFLVIFLKCSFCSSPKSLVGLVLRFPSRFRCSPRPLDCGTRNSSSWVKRIQAKVWPSSSLEHSDQRVPFAGERMRKLN